MNDKSACSGICGFASHIICYEIKSRDCQESRNPEEALTDFSTLYSRKINSKLFNHICLIR